MSQRDDSENADSRLKQVIQENSLLRSRIQVLEHERNHFRDCLKPLLALLDSAAGQSDRVQDKPSSQQMNGASHYPIHEAINGASSVAVPMTQTARREVGTAGWS